MPEVKDCDWVVERCKLHLSRDDRHNAKAWILTARSLFPENFAVQYEAFLLHICCGELKEAAKAFSDLFSNFPSEPQMKVYLSELVAEVVAKQTEERGREESSLERQTKRDLFQLLPSQMQKTILLQASEMEEMSDMLKKCRILQIALSLFPDSATTLGLDLCDVLSQQPSGGFPTVAENPFKELLVGEVIPALIESPEIRIEHPLTRTNGKSVVLKTSHLCQWLEAAASYYTSVTAQALTCNKPHPSAGKSGWEKLHRLFMLTAEKCGWREIMHSKTIGPHLSAKVRKMGLEKIAGYNPHVQTSFEAPRPVAIACFYIAVFLFFEMAWEYCSEILYPSGGGERSATGTRLPWILIEEKLAKPLTDDKAVKRRKLEDQHQAVLNVQTGTFLALFPGPTPSFPSQLHMETGGRAWGPGSRSHDQRMVECFLVATDCWVFLQSNVTYSRELSRLCQQWGAWDWKWLSSFRADMHMFKGDHNMAIQVLKHEWHKTKPEEKSKPECLRFVVQLVNCSAIVGDVKASCNFASEVISLLPDPITQAKATSTPDTPHHSKPTAVRQLRLLKCTIQEILPFCIQGIIQTLKDVAFSDPKNEHALGQLLVLLQYGWPAEEEVFASVITTIQKRRKFSFPDFFKYIITVDILEEMLYLSNCDGLQIILLPQSGGTKARAVTRGVNRGAREGLMAAMEKQLLRCEEESIEGVLREFFKHEKLSLGSET